MAALKCTYLLHTYKHEEYCANNDNLQITTHTVGYNRSFLERHLNTVQHNS